MKKLYIVDTRHFDACGVLLEQHEDHWTILENRRYLPPCTEKAWKKKILKTWWRIASVAKKVDAEPILVLPEKAFFNLIVEIKKGPLSVPQKITKALLQDFNISPQNLIYKYVKLTETHYFVSFTSKKFFQFIKKTLTLDIPFRIFPPIIGICRYFESLLHEDKPTTAVFIEDKLRRFFVQNGNAFSFIDLHQRIVDPSDIFGFKDLWASQTFIENSLEVSEEPRYVWIFGNLPDFILETYRKNKNMEVRLVKQLKDIRGFIKEVSILGQCIYRGLIKVENSKWRTFDFSTINFHQSIGQTIAAAWIRFFKKYDKRLIAALWLTFIALSAFVFKGYHQFRETKIINEHCLHLKDQLRTLALENRKFKTEYAQRVILPELFFKYCCCLQKIQQPFCVNYLALEHTDTGDFCHLKGHLVAQNSEAFTKHLKDVLKHEFGNKRLKKVFFGLSQTEGGFCEFFLKIPVVLTKK